MNIHITNQNVEDMPIGMGNAYWAHVDIETINGEDVYKVFELDDYGEIDEQAFHIVTFDDIREAFARLLINSDKDGNEYDIADYILKYFRNAVSDAENGQIDVGWIDTDATDVLMQVAIWDEVIYS